MKNILYVTILVSLFSCSTPQKDILPSWNDSENKTAIVNFVKQSTDPNSDKFIEEKNRIAVFDNDGTLWAEQPLYFQLIFAVDQIKKDAVNHPEWDSIPPYSYILNDDLESVLKSGEQGIIEIVMQSHTGMSSDEFDKMVRDWGAEAKHPTSGKYYTEMVYQPMLELLDYLRDNGFKTYIVSGGGIDFMRPLLSEVYMIPSEQIIGSSLRTQFVMKDGQPQIMRSPMINSLNDKDEKPVNIQKIIGKKPVICVGNSDGDLAMMQWTATQENYLNVYIHHTDSVREWAYDRQSHIGRLKKGLDWAEDNNWTVVDMKTDWSTIFPK